MKKAIGMILVLSMLFSLSLYSIAGAEDLGKSLVLYSSMTENDLNNLLSGFGEMYPQIDVEVVNGSTGELTSRIRAEKDNPQGDLMWGGVNNSDGDTHADIFEPWLSDHEDEIKDDYKSSNGFYNLDHLSTVVLCVNKNLEAELGIEIKGYADLLNPKLKGRIVLSDPNSSSAAWNNLANIMTVFGEDSEESWTYVENLMKNDLIIVTSSSVCFKGVEAGEYVVGLTYEDGASTLLKSGSENIRMVYPEEGASAFAFGVAIIKDAPHMAAAKAMVNYLMSAEGQSDLGTALGTLRFTNANANYVTPYLPPDAEINWVSRDIPWLVENKLQLLDHWNTLYASLH